MGLTDRVRGLTSRRITDIAPTEERPSTFQTQGGWGDPGDAPGTLPVDPATAEATARASGAAALAQLEAQRLQRAQEQRDAQLRGVARGYDFNRGLRFREGEGA